MDEAFKRSVGLSVLSNLLFIHQAGSVLFVDGQTEH
jgi:hypothetical protein